MQKEAKKHVKCYRAFTLVEVILVAGTIALVAGALAGLVRYSYEDWKFGSSRSTLLQDGRAAIGQMVRILRQARGFSAVSQSSDQAGDITFTDVDGITEQFKLNTATSELEYGRLGSLSALTGSVSNLVFTCYDINGDALADPVSARDIQSVHIETTLADTENSFTLSGRVFCPTDLASGEPGVFGNENVEKQDLYCRNIQFATQATLPEDGTVTSISAYVGGQNKELCYAIYTDSTGEPDTLVVESVAEFSGSTDGHWHEISITPTELSAGTYWLVLAFEGNNIYVTQSAKDLGQSRHKGNDAVANGFLSSWGASDESNTRRISIYAAYTSAGGG